MAKRKLSPAVQYFTFSQIVKNLLEGSKVTRKEWKNKEPVYLSEGFLCIDMEGKKNYLVVRDSDMIAEDWYIL